MLSFPSQYSPENYPVDRRDSLEVRRLALSLLIDLRAPHHSAELVTSPLEKGYRISQLHDVYLELTASQDLTTITMARYGEPTLLEGAIPLRLQTAYIESDGEGFYEEAEHAVFHSWGKYDAPIESNTIRHNLAKTIPKRVLAQMMEAMVTVSSDLQVGEPVKRRGRSLRRLHLPRS